MIVIAIVRVCIAVEANPGSCCRLMFRAKNCLLPHNAMWDGLLSSTATDPSKECLEPRRCQTGASILVLDLYRFFFLAFIAHQQPDPFACRVARQYLGTSTPSPRLGRTAISMASCASPGECPTRTKDKPANRCAVKQFIRNVRAAKTIADERAVIQKESASIRASFREESGDHNVRSAQLDCGLPRALLSG